MTMLAHLVYCHLLTYFRGGLQFTIVSEEDVS